MHSSVCGVLCLAAAFGVVACGPTYEKVDPETGIPILPLEAPDGMAIPSDVGTNRSSLRVKPTLEPSKSCEDLGVLFRVHAIEEMAARLQQDFIAAWNQKEKHCNKDHSGIDLSAMPTADAGVAAPTPEPSEEPDPEHSETNNQVAGVDEADFVKTDGKYIYILTEGELRIVKSWPAAETATVARLSIEGTPNKLFALEDRVLVYSSLPGGSHGSGYHGGTTSDCTYGYGCVPTGDGNPTKITIVDITDRATPKVVRELRLSSSLLAARRIGSAVHSVLVSAPMEFPAVRYRPEGLDVCERSRYSIYKAYRRLMTENIGVILKAEISGMIPSAVDTFTESGEQGTNPSPFAACNGFYKASIADGRRFTSVLSLGIDSTAPAKAVTILSKPGVVYASQESLYLAVPRFRGEWGWFSGLDGVKEATTLHKFKLASSQAGSTAYLASGVAKGRILNQFALDEHEGYLRLASTTGSFGPSMHNTLTVLEQKGALLTQKGALDQLAPTEDIRSVRFDGERGYVVTFKKTDPLFVLDLSTPAKPKLLGELKIPGFSTYMHRMDEDHLLTIGYDGDDQGMFAWFTSIALQIFDVTDPTKPKLKFKHAIGTRGSSSEAATNHLAFTYYAPKDLLALPMTVCEDSAGGGDYGANMTFSGLMVFDVTQSAGFTLKGKVEHPLESYVSCSNWWTQSSSVVKRSVIIGDFVYSISGTRIKVNGLADLNTDLAEVSLQ